MAATQTQTIREVRAQAKWVHCSARKARLVLDTIRGRSVPEARTVLAFSTRDVARDIDKVLRSAVANAEANHGFYGDDMIISACFADEGPRLKRWKPRARGRADRLIKGTCHITIRLASLTAAAETAAPKAVPKTEAPKPKPELPVETEGVTPPVGTADVTSGTTVTTSGEPAAEAKPKAPRKAAAKPRAKKTDKGEAKPKTATKRKPQVKKEEE
jgi:large subunit ribosomal protein L22